jgi:hypothetical protein
MSSARVKLQAVIIIVAIASRARWRNFMKASKEELVIGK